MAAEAELIETRVQDVSEVVNSLSTIYYRLCVVCRVLTNNYLYRLLSRLVKAGGLISYGMTDRNESSH